MAGEAKRRVEWKAKAEAAVELGWQYLGHLAIDLGLERGEMLGLLLEKGLLRGGLSVAEADRMTVGLEWVSEQLAKASAAEISDQAFAVQTSEQRLGDQPVEAQYREQITKVVQELDLIFNGKIGGPDRQTGFVLLVFPFGDEGQGRCNFASNGADRRDIVALMREMIARFEGQPELEGRA